jgi:hypothetical protein
LNLIKQLLAPVFFIIILESENRRFWFFGREKKKLGIKYVSISVIFKTLKNQLHATVLMAN